MKSFIDKIAGIFSLLALASCAVQTPELHLIPYPNQVVVGKGYCNLSKGIRMDDGAVLRPFVEEYFVEEHQIPFSGNGVELTFSLDPGIQHPEGYVLSVGKKKICIAAQTSAGHFYALQTLRQLLDGQKLPCVDIKDSPAYTWRAFMLDEARYFQGKETVKQLLDDMAMLKMNTFHWHLTDDAGWRIEVRKYPLLTEIGSHRDSTQIEDPLLDTPGQTGNVHLDAFLRRYESQKFDGRPHDGFYTQEDVREIVAYAAERHIQIVPEISMPGHGSAAIAAYPWLGTEKQKVDVPLTFGVKYEVYDVSSPRVMQFFRDVLTEVSALFPSDFIHVGGDEVRYDHWQKSASVQRYMQQHRIGTCRELQVYFTNEICSFIENDLGKRMIGWNEILGVNCHPWGDHDVSATSLSPKAVVQFWAGGGEILQQALEKGYDVVHSFSDDTYINYSYDQIPLERAYAFNPHGKDGPDCRIMGLGCQLWTEWIPDRQTLEYQVYPRIAAYAETGWTQVGNKSYARFTVDLQLLLAYWRAKGYILPEKY